MTDHTSSGQGWNFTDERQGTRSLVFHPFLKVPDPNQDEALSLRSPENRLEEAVSLGLAIGLECVVKTLIPLNKVKASTYIGGGKIEELAARIKAEEINLVIADCKLSPLQQRNLEKDLEVKVIDRTGLILEIFGERAQTREGVLQVDLAHLEYQKSRLVRSWTHLERQRGGGGFMGGPGERQIESDRRMIRDRIARLKKQLKEVERTRTLHREARDKVPFPIVAFVGYTNAGKSTLFNRLTEASVMAKDMLFATLDPTMRSINLPDSGKKIILSDTVGFISDLPTELIAAFKATLEEVLSAHVIVHIYDAAHPDVDAQVLDVENVLKSLGIDIEGVPFLEVANKVDLMEGEALEDLLEREQKDADFITLSAFTGAGTDKLLKKLNEVLAQNEVEIAYVIPFSEGAARAWLYQTGHVTKAEMRADEGSEVIEVRLSGRKHDEFLAKYPRIKPSVES